MQNSLGVFYTCFNEKNAIDYSISELLKVYPDIPIYLVSDGGLDFSYLTKNIKNFSFELGKDTMSETFSITGDPQFGNFKDFDKQFIIKNCALTLIERLKKCINFCKTEYILMMDPDTLVRGQLTIPDGVKLLGSKVNIGTPDEFKKVLSEVDGSKVIDTWGATPAIFHSETFLKSAKLIENNIELLDKLSMSFYAIYAHDVLLPTLFALIGEEETYNPDIIECHRDHDWKFKNNPLVHQFREYY
jgi:hypothetical protein